MPAEPKHILLVEDSPNDIELMLTAFGEYQVSQRVAVTRDGAEALDYLYRRGRYEGRAGGNPVVVLLDLKLPKVDGLEVLALLKGDEELRTVPVVMLTSSREERDLLRSYNLGANAYVVKPLDFGEFVEALGEVKSFWTEVNQSPPGVAVPAGGPPADTDDGSGARWDGPAGPPGPDVGPPDDAVHLLGEAPRP
jgi:CheY-like chemotaxis protein